MLGLLGELGAELASLERTHAEHARSIAGFTEAAARESTRPSEPPSPCAVDLNRQLAEWTAQIAHARTVPGDVDKRAVARRR